MKLHTVDNVLEAYQRGVKLLRSGGALVEDSRAGEVRVWPDPVVTVTRNPHHCVLLDRTRRANPFFHVYEALWMLSGSQDARLLDTFVSDFSERFGESDGRQHGAYGWRWRRHWSMDQISIAVERLRRDHRDRRVVIAMWDPMVDATYSTAESQPRDIPCNTHIYPRIVGEKLSLTVCCRSNDAIWGAHGANAVHFSFLLQYMAARIGVGIGELRQLSNNYHMYTATARELDESPPQADWGAMMPMVTDPVQFMESACQIVREPLGDGFSDPWVAGVARWMFQAHDAWRQRDREIFDMTAAGIQCPVWRQAVLQWWPS